MLDLLGNYVELRRAAADMDSALASYRDGVDSVQIAAKDLASKWEGDGQVAFVNDQDAAYQYYTNLWEVVREMINEARRTADRYEKLVNDTAAKMGR